MKKLYFLIFLIFISLNVYSAPLKIVSEEDELNVFNNLLKVTYSFEGAEDYAYIDKANIDSDTWVVYFHSYGGNARELVRSHVYHDLWINAIRDAKIGALDINMFGDSFFCPLAQRGSHYLVQWAKEKYHIKKLIFIGSSMGAFCALRYGEIYPEDADCIIAISPLSSLNDFIKRKDFVNLGDSLNQNLKKFFPGKDSFEEYNLYDRAKNLSMPVYICHSREDEIVPISQSDKLAHLMKFNNKFKYKRFEKGNHIDTFSFGFTDAWEWYLNLEKEEM